MLLRFIRVAAIAAVALTAASRAYALDILLCNDDGFTSANTRALYELLVSVGHHVVVAAPVDNQSGRGGFISFLAPIPPIAASYVDNYTGRPVSPRALRVYPSLAGTPGIGTDPSNADIAYVNGSPVMACLYGIDVKAPKTFGHAPDLVISGPNEGNNLGHINISSGTAANAFYGINRGLPTIAVSDAVTTQIEFTALTTTSRAREVAVLVARLVDALASRASDRERERWDDRNEDRRDPSPLLPAGVGLSVNVPAFAPGAAASLGFSLTHMGVATPFAPAFYEDLGLSPITVPGLGGRAGIGLAPSGTTLPTGVVIPTDNARRSEGNVIALGGRVSVSVVTGVPDVETEFLALLRGRLRDLLK